MRSAKEIQKRIEELFVLGFGHDNVDNLQMLLINHELQVERIRLEYDCNEDLMLRRLKNEREIAKMQHKHCRDEHTIVHNRWMDVVREICNDILTVIVAHFK